MIRMAVRIRLISLFPELLRWMNTNGTKHRMLQIMDAQYDHVVPHARGGETSLENLLLTCAPCNYGRNGFTLGEMRLVDPRTRILIPSEWDGLERLLTTPVSSNSPQPTE